VLAGVLDTAVPRAAAAVAARPAPAALCSSDRRDRADAEVS
jgi:hypothetical protein